MANEETQQEEREVLESIYESDECFKQLSPTSFSCRIGEQGHPQSFLVEIKWGEGYPDELPTISLDSFYNTHLTQECKKAIIEALEREAEPLLGFPITYTLLQHAQDHVEELVTVAQKDGPSSGTQACDEGEMATEGRKKVKKEVLSKRAKRRLADRTNVQGERPRGWDWVDIVKLSKTGSQLT